MSPKKNLTKMLVDDYGLGAGFIAKHTGASIKSVWNWYSYDITPYPPYHEALLELEQRFKERGKGKNDHADHRSE